jgi:hypothetical protein
VALTAACLGLVGSVAAADAPAPGPDAGPKQPGAQQPGPAAAPGGTYVGLPCPPPMPSAPCGPPPCVGPTDNTQFNVPTFHLGFDYLYWFPRKSSLPPLVTSGNAADPLPAALGRPSTQVLLQGTGLEEDHLQGGRLTLGVGTDSGGDWSFLVTAFLLEQGKRSLTFGSDASGTTVLGRPFFNLATGNEDADRFAIAGAQSGAVNVSQLRRFYGGDADAYYENLCSDDTRLFWLAGVKVLTLDESLNFARRSTALAGASVGTVISQSENLAASNRFYGGQVGAQYEFRLGPVFLQATGKVALGVVDVNPNLTAFTLTSTPTTGVTLIPNQGLYVSPSTAGRSHRTKFAVSPEANFRLGFDFNDWVRLSAGYTFIGLTETVRAGDLINRNVNPLTNTIQVPIQTLVPHASMPSSTFWAQGLDVSLRFSF